MQEVQIDLLPHKSIFATCKGNLHMVERPFATSLIIKK